MVNSPEKTTINLKLSCDYTFGSEKCDKQIDLIGELKIESDLVEINIIQSKGWYFKTLLDCSYCPEHSNLVDRV